jgi:hypothetical protein
MGKKTLLIAYIEMVPIRISYVPEPKLTRLAVNEYNEYKHSQGDYVLDISINSKPALLDRIRKNYIRHNLTNYDKILDEIIGHKDMRDVYPILKQKVMDRIDIEWKKQAAQSINARRALTRPLTELTAGFNHIPMTQNIPYTTP